VSPMHHYRTIVVGTDGSPLAGPTVARAAWLAAHSDADLVIVCAYSEAPAPDAGEPPAGQVNRRSAASAAIAAAVTEAERQSASTAVAVLVNGEPAAALLATAEQRGADLIVVGALRVAGVAELGSVATEVARRASCEVLVVRRPGS